MTINLSDNSPRISYTVASGVTQSSFTVPFEFFEEGDLNVYVDGTLKTITTDYTVSGGSGSTGTIAMTVVGASGGSTVVLTRSIPLERTTDFPTSGPFDVTSLNEELDRITAINADLNDEVNRSLRLTDADAAANLTLPTVASRAGKVLAFDLTTGDLVNGPSTAGVTTVAAAAADIATLADIQDGTVATNAITDAAAIKTNITTVAGIASNVTTVAGNTANVNTVAGNTTNINTIAGNNANVTTVAGVSGNVTTVAGISADVTAVAGDATDIGTVSANIANVNSVSAIDADVTTVAGMSSADITTVAGISSDVTTAAGISTNITTVAGIAADVIAAATNASDISAIAAEVAKVVTVANDLNEATSEIDVVANNIANVNAVGADIAAVINASNNLSDINAFGDTYFISATAPASPTTGDLWFDTTSDTMKVYGASGFQNAGSSVNGTSQRTTHTATAGQTTFAATYDAGYIDVYLNGIKLIVGTDFTATSGTDIVLATGAAAGDTLDTVAYGTFSISNFSINDANDVAASAATNGQFLQYNGSNWVGGTVSTPTLSSLGLDNHDDITVDASGNLLVGKAASNVAAEGAEIRPNGFTGLTVDGGAGLTVRRLTSDGEIQSFFKDTTKVGAIGVGNTNRPYIGSGDTGIMFDANNNAIYPWDTNTNNPPLSHQVDLGYNATGLRFKDLYLSGSISDGNNSKTVADIVSGGGKVAQVVNHVDTSYYSASGANSTLSWSINITPTSASSKILLHWVIFWNSSNPNSAMFALRNGGNLNPNISVAGAFSGTGHFHDWDEAPTNIWNIFPQTMIAHDSPASTSQQTYLLGIENVSAAATVYTGRSPQNAGYRSPSFVGYAMEILP